MSIWLRVLIISLLTFSTSLQASDLAKEKRWADQIVDAILDGDAIWLKEGKHDFLGILTEAEDDQQRAVIIMHGTGIHPDWQQVIQPLRVGLIEHGWHTLSIQMPVLHNDAFHSDYAPLFDQVPARIDAAVARLKKMGVNKISLIGHSLGSSMGAYYLSQTKTPIHSFVAIGLNGRGEDPRMNGANSIKQFKVPMLDLFGSNDLDDILDNVDLRAAAAKQAKNKHYRQTKVKGANHFFDGKEEELVSIVAEWLGKSGQ